MAVTDDVSDVAADVAGGDMSTAEKADLAVTADAGDDAEQLPESSPATEDQEDGVDAPAGDTGLDGAGVSAYDAADGVPDVTTGAAPAERKPLGARTRCMAKKSQTSLYRDIQDLIGLLCNSSVLEEEMDKAGFDLIKIPLATLQRSSIREGMTWLRAIERELQKPTPMERSLQTLSKSFFKVLPFKLEGNEEQPKEVLPSDPPPHVISDREDLRAKLQAVEALGEVEAVYARLTKLEAGGGRRKPPPSDEASDAPPKPRPAYFAWYLANRPAIVAEMDEGAKVYEIAKKAGEKWREMEGGEERLGYEARYREHKELYDAWKRADEAKRALLAEAADPLIARLYRNLGCTVSVIRDDTPTWRLICDYARTSQVLPTGSDARYGRVVRIFALSRSQEEKNYVKYATAANRTLLWHGAPLAAMSNVLMSGLRTQVPESPMMSYLYGRGVYLTDVASAAASSARLWSRQDRASVLLVEAALQNCRTVQAPDPTPDKTPKAFHSTHCNGCVSTEPANARSLGDGVRIPFGPVIWRAAACTPTCGLAPHSTYVVHDPSQVRLRYLVDMQIVHGEEAAEAFEEDELAAAAAYQTALAEAEAAAKAAAQKAEAARAVAAAAKAAKEEEEAARKAAEASTKRRRICGKTPRELTGR
eukprot:TRINITY_DN41697_c0_g2_i1.p1 TRINITY_DN41697_c0_g2~~TRINITY_DN41697_c0_g2_i1.p1  ORF type:complete len:648 (-),score=151.65 TRINITY_DN41697_c0_g2_i1:120-2063(-)